MFFNFLCFYNGKGFYSFMSGSRGWDKGSVFPGNRLGVNYYDKVINYIQLHWKLFN